MTKKTKAPKVPKEKAVKDEIAKSDDFKKQELLKLEYLNMKIENVKEDFLRLTEIINNTLVEIKTNFTSKKEIESLQAQIADIYKRLQAIGIIGFGTVAVYLIGKVALGMVAYYY